MNELDPLTKSSLAAAGTQSTVGSCAQNVHEVGGGHGIEIAALGKVHNFCFIPVAVVIEPSMGQGSLRGQCSQDRGHLQRRRSGAHLWHALLASV